MSLRAEGEAILPFSLLRRSAPRNDILLSLPRNDFYAPKKGGGYIRGASPLQSTLNQQLVWLCLHRLL